MQKQLTVRQACIIMFVLLVANKLMLLPSIISFASSSDSWLVFIFSFFVDFVMAMVIVAVMAKLDENIFQFLERKIGRVLTIIIASIIGLIFFMKIADLFMETFIMYNEKIYVDFSLLLYLLVIYCVIIYFGTRELRSLGRTVEILFTLILGGLILSFFISVGSADFSNILPLLETGVGNISRNAFNHIFWFADSFVMLFFVGNIKKEKGMSKKMLLSYLATMVIVVLFVILFISVFSNTASFHKSCILDIGENLPRLLTEGRFNWIVYFIYPITPIFAIAIYSYCAVKCTSYATSRNLLRKKLFAVLFTLLSVSVILILTGFLWAKFYNFSSSIMPYVCVAIEVIFPIILMIMSFVDNKKKAVKYEKKAN